MKSVFIIVLLFTMNILSSGQACCTAGTPILGSLELSSGRKGVLDIGVTFERNVLRDIYEGSSPLVDYTRERMTESLLVELNYGISSRLTATLLTTFVNQIRIIRPLTGISNEVVGRGIGDMVLLMKYSIIKLDMFDRRELAVGGGVKIPSGSSMLKSGGLLLPADMQPGTGSWDAIFWTYYSKEISGSFPLTYIVNLSYRINSTNERFGKGNGGYGFGNEFIANIGLLYRTDTVIDYSFLIRFRNTKPDKFSGDSIPNTGGSWLNLVPGLNIKIYESFLTRISGQLPVYRNLLGTQLTTTYTASLALFYSFDLNN